MSNEISKQDYLKRYLEKDKKLKRKKKTEANNAKISRLKIVDHNIDIKSLNFGDKDNTDDIDDEAPIVAEVIDDRPLGVKVQELYESSRWKKLGNAENSQLDKNENQGISNNTDTTSLRKSLTSSKKVQHNCDSSVSPPRKVSQRKRHDSSSDTSPPRGKIQKTRHDSGSDLSPPRQVSQKKRYDSRNDLSPPRKISQKRHDSGSDLSPSRKNSQKKRHDSGSDLSPPRKSSQKKRHDSDSDISLPRKKSQKKKHDSESESDLSPPRKIYSTELQDSKSNLSSHRKDSSQKKKYDSDVSSPRKSKGNSRVKRLDSDGDFSPPRIHKDMSSLKRHNYDDGRNSKHKIGSKKREGAAFNSDSDLSPPYSESSKRSIENKSRKPQKTLSGLKAGLQNAMTLREETEQLRKREKTQINMLDDDLSGRNAETIIRDRKTGLRRDLDQEQKVKDEENQKNEEQKKKYAEWGKGIEQTQSKMDKFADDVYEMSKPLARYRDDEDLDERLKAIIHDDDPMSAYIKKKRQKNMPVVPAYSGPPAPPNRFGIMPGYRWDGVDRSNGFEKKYFEKINSTKAIQEESYLWSVQDM